MRHVLEQEGLAGRFECDSAGTAGYHIGKSPDTRMRKHGNARGLAIEGAARQVSRADLDEFDLILAMDRDNQADLMRMARTDDQRAKIRLMCDFLTEHEEDEVPDPYYGGPEGFERVLDLLEDACSGLLRHLRDGSPSASA